MIGECYVKFRKIFSRRAYVFMEKLFWKKNPIKQTSYVGVYFLRIIKIQYVENNIICLWYKKKKKIRSEKYKFYRYNILEKSIDVLRFVFCGCSSLFISSFEVGIAK